MNQTVLDGKVLTTIKEWKQEHSQPISAFIYDLQALRERARQTVSGLPEGCRLFYAIKANPTQEILKCLEPIVYGFEAASIGEIRKIRQVSSDKPVIFGGPGKKDNEIEEALLLQVKLIHAESILELRRISHIATRLGIQASVLIRVNLRASFPEATLIMAGRPTQFGIDEEQIEDAILLTQSLPNLQLEGFHLHSISNNLDAHLHARLISVYLERVKGWRERFGLTLNYLNAGGGFGISYTDSERKFEWDTFVSELRQVLYQNAIPGVELLFEPGRYIAAACGYYATEVVDLKCNHGKHYAILRGGSHHFRLPGAWQHSHPFEIVPVEQWNYPFGRPEVWDVEITVAGELCTPKDVLARDIQVSRLRVGDILLFTLAGAYGWTISAHDFLSHEHPDHIFL
ncbi:type III PLP-dependent enzyme [Paenibacillus sp. WQ 127069]|uniref:Type III PLP-dependent enzyme n=1 Tax=Paenibacillus baimaensis TaxID=2982185 RepID=A0ABT2UH75_9BACL|nr:type III PLP-dependent enzyme [Paenibacillus sp. WQ 127069]MCU6793998.1 type III PLP-dependent enzyme [Paenibacillus sp. WQ 127069]